ncbi:MAG: N-acetyl sugar amidotransferase, partial [Candidatus Margulisbacteria bacterium]|nr:N-acetyl sugar amidotransferase [Candidatus Margulisiibacteriota bacterium]
SATDYAARMVRYGMITRERAFELVREHDHALDPLSVRDFCDFLGYSEKQFWGIVDKLYNTEIFYEDKNGSWKLKNEIDN